MSDIVVTLKNMPNASAIDTNNLKKNLL